MAKPKTDKTVKSINFEDEVLKALEIHCKRNNVPLSAFVNTLIRRVVMSEYEFYRQMSKNTASELAKYRTLMDTARDKPGGEE